MAGWLSALKLVPWGQVIEAAPQVVQSARKLMRRSEPPAAAQAAPASAAAEAGTSPQEELRAQLHALQQQLDGVREDQQASAVLIRSLAEQNAQLVHAVDALRARTRWLGVACALLGVTTLGLLIWTLRL